MPDSEPEQIAMMKRLVELSLERSKMSAERSYMNGERTLAVWIRTALALMIFGIAMDRFGLLLRQTPPKAHTDISPHALSSWGGEALIALGVLMALSSGLRFAAFALAYRRLHQLPLYHGPVLGPLFAGLVVLFGIALLVILRVFTA